MISLFKYKKKASRAITNEMGKFWKTSCYLKGKIKETKIVLFFLSAEIQNRRQNHFVSYQRNGNRNRKRPCKTNTVKSFY